MGDNQYDLKEWRQKLDRKREDLKGNIGAILQQFAKELALNNAALRSEPEPNPTRPSNQTGGKKDASVQTDPVQLNGHSESPDELKVDPIRPQSSAVGPIMSPPVKEEEVLRAELAAMSAQVVGQESSIRSLTQVAINLRETLSELYTEREQYHKQLREAEAKELTIASEMKGLKTAVERASDEVNVLRQEIRNFHQPTSRLYKSIKDAVLREMRGEEPLSHAQIDSAIWVSTSRASSSNDESRPHKRPRLDTSNSDISSRSRMGPSFEGAAIGNSSGNERPDLSLRTDRSLRNHSTQSAPNMSPSTTTAMMRNSLPITSAPQQGVQNGPPQDFPVFNTNLQLVRRPMPAHANQQQYTGPIQQTPQYTTNYQFVSSESRGGIPAGSRQEPPRAHFNGRPPQNMVQMSPPGPPNQTLQNLPQNPPSNLTPHSRSLTLPGGWHPRPSNDQQAVAQSHSRKSSNGSNLVPMQHIPHDKALPPTSSNPPHMSVPMPREGQINTITQAQPTKRILPFSLDDPHAMALCALLWLGSGGRAYTCRQCGVIGELGADYKNFFQHSHTQHKEAFDQAYFEIFTETNS